MKKQSSKQIGLLTSSFLPNLGGVEIGIHNIAKNLILIGHNPIVFTSWLHKKNLKKNNLKLSYKVISFPPRFLYLINVWPNLFLYLNHLILNYWKWKYKIDIWHGTFCHPIGTLLGYHKIKTNNKFILRAVGEDIQIMPEINYGIRLNSKINKLIKKYIVKADALIATTNTIKEEYLKLGIDKFQIKQIPNGIDLKYFKNFKPSQNLKNKLGIGKDNFVFLSLGRYHAKKNFISVIKASKILKSNGINNFSFIIAGRGTSKLSNKISQYNISNTVKIIDTNNYKLVKNNSNQILHLPSKDILSLYFLSDCFVMPSLIESFGIVTIEAMAFGLPILISKSKGNIDVVRNGKDAILYENDANGKNLAFEMQKILNDKKIYDFYKLKSFKRAQNFDWVDIVMEYCHLYDEILTDKN